MTKCNVLAVLTILPVPAVAHGVGGDVIVWYLLILFVGMGAPLVVGVAAAILGLASLKGGGKSFWWFALSALSFVALFGVIIYFGRAG